MISGRDTLAKMSLREYRLRPHLDTHAGGDRPEVHRNPDIHRPKATLGSLLDRYHFRQGSPVNHQKQMPLPSVPCRGFADTVGSHREDQMIHDKAAARKVPPGIILLLYRRAWTKDPRYLYRDRCTFVWNSYQAGRVLSCQMLHSIKAAYSRSWKLAKFERHRNTLLFNNPKVQSSLV